MLDSTLDQHGHGLGTLVANDLADQVRLREVLASVMVLLIWRLAFSKDGLH